MVKTDTNDAAAPSHIGPSEHTGLPMFAPTPGAHLVGRNVAVIRNGHELGRGVLRNVNPCGATISTVGCVAWCSRFVPGHPTQDTFVVEVP